MAILEEFSFLSNYKINLTKSVEPNINLTLNLLLQNFSFTWSTKFLLSIPANPIHTFDLNFAPLLTNILLDMGQTGLFMDR